MAPFLAAILLAAAPAADVPKQLELDVGAQKLLDVKGIQRVAVGDPAVADVHPVSADQLLVVGKGEGRTTLLVWSGAKTVLKVELRVARQTHAALERALREALPAEDLRVTEVNGKRVVEGHVLSTDDLARLHVLVDGEPDVVLLVDLDRSAQTHLVNRINAELQRQGLKDAHAELVGSRIFLEGHVEEEADAQRAQLIAESIAGAHIEALR